MNTKEISTVDQKNIQGIDLSKLSLNKNGCEYFSQILNTEIINQLKNAVADFIIKKKIYHYTNAKRSLQGSNFVLNCGHNKPIQDYHQMKNFKKSVINVRGDEHGNSDTNLLDFFNPHHIFGEYIKKVINMDILLKILESKSGKKWYLDRINLYVNIGIKNTRKFHTDTKYPYVKVFIPLTDVNDIDDGTILLYAIQPST